MTCLLSSLFRFVLLLAALFALPLFGFANGEPSARLFINGNDGSGGPVVVEDSDERLTISWEGTGVTACKGNWSPKELAGSGSQRGRITAPLTFRVTCTSADGSEVSASVFVKFPETEPVRPPPQTQTPSSAAPSPEPPPPASQPVPPSAPALPPRVETPLPTPSAVAPSPVSEPSSVPPPSDERAGGEEFPPEAEPQPARTPVWKSNVVPGQSVKVIVPENQRPPAEFVPLAKEEKTAPPEQCLDASGQRVFADNPKPFREQWAKQAQCAQKVAEATLLLQQGNDVADVLEHIERFRRALAAMEKESLALAKEREPARTYLAIPLGKIVEKSYETVDQIGMQCVKVAGGDIGGVPAAVGKGRQVKEARKPTQFITATAEQLKKLAEIKQKAQAISAKYRALVQDFADLAGQTGVLAKVRRLKNESEALFLASSINGLITSVQNDFVLQTPASAREYGIAYEGDRAVEISLTQTPGVSCAIPTMPGIMKKFMDLDKDEIFAPYTIIIDGHAFPGLCLPVFKSGEGLALAVRSTMGAFNTIADIFAERATGIFQELKKLEASGYGCSADTADPTAGENRVVRKFVIPRRQSASFTTGEQRVLVLLVDYADSNASDRPFTPEEAQKIIFEGDFGKFYTEQSYRRISFTGDVYGWFRIPRNMVPGKPYPVTNEELQKIISENKIDLGDYHYLITTASHPGWGAGSANRGPVSVLDTVMGRIAIGLSDYHSIGEGNMTVFAQNLGHEMAHALGLDHASYLHCGDKLFRYAVRPTCTGETNYYEIVGYQQFSAHLNGFFKEALGWLRPDETVRITQSGTYTLTPLERASGVRVAKIPIADNEFYYLEFRRGFGYNSNLVRKPALSDNRNGLFVYYVRTGENPLNQSTVFLLDMTPAQPFVRANDGSIFGYSDQHNVALGAGKTFTDSDNSIVIGPVVSADDDRIVFRISFSKSTDAPTQPSFTAPVAPGGVVKTLVCGTLGDVNNDGSLSQADVELIRSFVFETATPTAAQRAAADVNADADINVIDILLLNGYLAGTRTTFPGCTPVPPSPETQTLWEKIKTGIGDLLKPDSPPSTAQGNVGAGNVGTPVVPLTASCAPAKTSAKTGETVTWNATARGGSGSYRYEWLPYNTYSGSPTLSGPSLRIVYTTAEVKDTAVKVVSGTESVTELCAPSVKVEPASPAPVSTPPPAAAPSSVAANPASAQQTTQTTQTAQTTQAPPASPPPPPPPAPAPLPSVDFAIDGVKGPYAVVSGTFITPSWSSANASHCTTNWNSDRSTANPGFTIGPVTADKTYTVTCYNSTGESVSASVAVTVTAPAAPSAPVNLSLGTPSVSGEATGDGRLYVGNMTISVSVSNTGGEVGDAAVQFQYSTNNINFYDWLSGGRVSVPPGGSVTASGSWQGGTGFYYFRARIGETYSPSTSVEIIARVSLNDFLRAQVAAVVEAFEALFRAF